jgi:hypothetical protein
MNNAEDQPPLRCDTCRCWHPREIFRVGDSCNKLFYAGDPIGEVRCDGVLVEYPESDEY